MCKYYYIIGTLLVREKDLKSLSPQSLWKTNDDSLKSLIEANILVPKPKKVQFYTPSFMYYKTSQFYAPPIKFSTISITGKICYVNCQHCEGRILKTMKPAITPEKLFEKCKEMKDKGVFGCLVSGGCLPNGSVPLKQFIPTLKRIKKEFGLTLFVHTGIIEFETASALKEAGVDATLIDIIGSNETINEICQLNLEVKDYEQAIRALDEACLNFVPHIVVGLHNGKLKGELQALKILSNYRPAAIVIIAFVPIHGTKMSSVKPADPMSITRTIATARLMYPKIPLVLGCVRPKRKNRAETEILALKAGANAIAFPSEKTIKFAEENNYEITFSDFCCAYIGL